MAEKIKDFKRQSGRIEKALGLIVYTVLSPLFFAGRKKIILDENLLFDLYVGQELTCQKIADIVGHSEDLVHRTLRGMEKTYGMKILRDRNASLYKEKRGSKKPTFHN